jgi:hypothetical protein
MQLIFRSRRGSSTIDWSEYALLRDNVQHYLESGPGRTLFAALHAVEHAVDGEARNVSALELRRELQRAWVALGDLKLEQSAVSFRTHAILTGCDQPPPVRGTVLAKVIGWPLPVVGHDEQLLRSHVANFIGALLTITERSEITDDVRVTRA